MMTELELKTAEKLLAESKEIANELADIIYSKVPLLQNTYDGEIIMHILMTGICGFVGTFIRSSFDNSEEIATEFSRNMNMFVRAELNH